MGVLSPCKLDCCCLPFSPNVVPAPVFSAALSRSFPFGKSWRSIPFRRSFSCNRQNKKPIHRDIKNRRGLCSRFKMMFYVSALNFKDGTVYSSAHSLTVPKSIKCGRQYFCIATVGDRRLVPLSQSKHPVFGCSPRLRGIILYQKTRRKSRCLQRVLNIF